RFDDQALVGPRAGGAGRAGGQEDRRAVGAEGGGRVVHVVAAVDVRDVGRPQVVAAVGVGVGPRGAAGEGRAGVAPGGAVGGGLERDAVTGVGQQVRPGRGLGHLRVVHSDVPGHVAGAGVGGRRGGGVVELDEPPLLVGPVVVGVLGDAGAVGGGPLPHLQGLAAVAVEQVDEAVVGVDHTELLVGAVEVGPLHHLGPVGGGMLVDVQNLAAVA